MIGRLASHASEGGALDAVQARGYACVDDQVAVAVPWRDAGVLGALTVTDVTQEQVESIARVAQTLVAVGNPETA